MLSSASARCSYTSCRAATVAAAVASASTPDATAPPLLLPLPLAAPSCSRCSPAAGGRWKHPAVRCSTTLSAATAAPCSFRSQLHSAVLPLRSTSKPVQGWQEAARGCTWKAAHSIQGARLAGRSGRARFDHLAQLPRLVRRAHHGQMRGLYRLSKLVGLQGTAAHLGGSASAGRSWWPAASAAQNGWGRCSMVGGPH